MTSTSMRLPKGIYVALIDLLRPYPQQAAGLCFVALVGAFLEGIGVSLLIPLLQSLEGSTALTGNRVIDLLNSPFRNIPANSRLQTVIGVLFAVVIVKNGFTYAHLLIDEWFRIKIMRELRLRVNDQLLRVGYRYITERRSGEFLSSFNNDVPRTGTAVRALLKQVVVISTVAVYLAFLFVISWELTVIALALLTLISWPMQVIIRKAQSIGEELTDVQSELSAVNLETLSGMRLIRILGRESREQERYRVAVLGVDRLYLCAARLHNLVRPISEVFAFAVLGVLLLASSRFMANQEAAVMPVIVTFLFVLFRLLPQATQFNHNRAEIAKHVGAVEAVFDILSDENKPYIISGTNSVPEMVEGIAFSNVRFSYGDADDPIIKDLDLKIPARQVTALVGSSGAGKSTIVDLIPRFYDPDSGSITIDGIDLRELDLAAWRSKIGFVSQDTFVFASSIRDNIAYGKEDASWEEIERAAHRANAYDFVSRFPRGFDTMVGDRGVRLSGGQLQRIAIARAIVRDPDLLILDEATSALDTASERLIQDSIDSLRIDRTVLVVAHRLSTIINADQVVVIEDGTAIESGSHEELLDLGGAYFRFHSLQFEAGKA